MFRLFAALGLGAIIGLAPASGSPAATAGPGFCFGPRDGAGLPFALFRYPSVPPRTDAEAGYPDYPLTASASANIARLNASKASEVRKYFVVWVNHCNAAPGNACHRPAAGALASAKANPLPHPALFDPATRAKLTSVFTSYAAADACTKAQVAWVLGHDAARVRAEAAGAVSLVVDRSKLDGLPRDAHGRFTDVCVTAPEAASAQVDGVFLDYEAHDGRTAAMARDLLLALVRLAHEKQRRIVLYTNPLDAPGQGLSGLGAENLNELQAAFDSITLLIARKDGASDPRRSFAAQMALLRAGPRPVDPARLMVTFQLSDTTLADAKAVRDLVLENHIAAVTLWQNRADLSGGCDTPLNRKITCLTKGQCGG